MKSRLMRLTMLAMVLALTAGVAQADTFTIPNGGSVTLTYTAVGFPGSTATATLSLSGSTLTITLTNTSTDLLTRLTGFAMNTTPNITVNNLAGTLVGMGWGMGGGSGVGGFEFGAGNPGNCSGALCVTGTASGTLILTLSSAPNSLTIDTSIVHLQSLPDGNSQKPTGTTTTVPEPASMLLLGTGLLGAGSFVRRRMSK